MIDKKIIEDYEDKEISKVILEYYELADNSFLGLQQCLEEIKQLKDYLGDRKFNRFVEIGCDEGGSLYVYSRLFLNPGADIYTVDIFFKPTANKVIGKLTDLGYKVHPVTAYSQDLDVKNFNYDLLHIDGDHSYASVRGDFDRCYPSVSEGGVCLLHDTLLWPGAIKTREELEKTHNTKTFRGYTLISGDFYITPQDGERQSTGITLVHK